MEKVELPNPKRELDGKMKSKIHFLCFIFIFFNSCIEKRVESKIINSEYKPIELDSAWKKIQFTDGHFFYYPASWKTVKNDHYTLSFNATEGLYFYLDIKDFAFQTPQDYENFLRALVKDQKIQEDKILKVSYKKSSDILYYFDALGTADRKMREVSNFYVRNKKVYRFAISSNEHFDDTYIDTLNIITNSYFVNENERLVQFENGYDDVEFLEK